MGFGSSLGSVAGGLINAGRKLPSIDLSALFDTIRKSGAYQKELINNLPASLKPLYDQYQTSLGEAGTTLQNTTNEIGQNLLDRTKAVYDPNGAAAQATLAALKMQDYSTLPGTLTNLRAQLAATGGLARGGAGKALTSAVLAPAAQYAQQAANTTAQQLNLGQNATIQAINKVASMDDATANSLFGMSKEQASQILQYGRQDLRDQLTQLINQSVQESNQMLGVQGIQAQNAYQNALTRNQQQAAITNGLVDLGINGVSSFATSGMGGGAGAGMSGLPAGADVGSASYFQNALANAPVMSA